MKIYIFLLDIVSEILGTTMLKQCDELTKL